MLLKLYFNKVHVYTIYSDPWNPDRQTDRQICYINKCIGDDTKAAARQNLNCIKNKKIKYGENDFQYGGWNSYTLQCGMWLWDDMPLNSPKRPPYWNSTSGFHFHISPQSTCHSVPVCEILSKSDNLGKKKIISCRFSRWRISAILDCRDPIMGSLKSPVKLT